MSNYLLPIKRLGTWQKQLALPCKVVKISCFQMVQMYAMTGIETAIIGPTEDSVEVVIVNGWDKTAKNPAICVAMAGVSYLIQNLFGL